ncbi:MAG: hypothetical protein LBV73_02350, partial [Paraburkholderia sp.]|nr:hypothetical protein [Paraburkholderia sp.]
ARALGEERRPRLVQNAGAIDLAPESTPGQMTCQHHVWPSTPGENEWPKLKNTPNTKINFPYQRDDVLMEKYLSS